MLARFWNWVNIHQQVPNAYQGPQWEKSALFIHVTTTTTSLPLQAAPCNYSKD